MKKNHRKMIHLILKEIIRPIILLFLLGGIYLFLFRKFGIGIPCILNKLTGFQCPGCGMTRAFSKIWEGDFYAAWNYNALSITILPVLCFYLIYRRYKEITAKDETLHKGEYILLVMIGSIMLIYTIIRN